MRRGQLTGALGRFLLCVGTLILLFVAYQLWGTDIAESHSQSVLRTQFEQSLRRAERAGGRPATSTTTTTVSAAGQGQRALTAPATDAPAEGRPVGLLQIPKIGVDKVIVEGTGTADLRQGPGHYFGTPLPGQAGNAAIAGHRTTYGAPFYNLNELGRGDTIVITTIQGVFTYSVSRSEEVTPGNTSVLAQSSTPELTLTTCTPRFSASNRLVVQATLLSSSLAAAAPTPAPTPAPTAGRLKADAADLAGGQGDWLPALWWGMGVAAVAGAVWWLARRQRRRPQRWLVYTSGAVAVLIVLFYFFGAVSPLLPASF